jgi:hypothetical protein
MSEAISVYDMVQREMVMLTDHGEQVLSRERHIGEADHGLGLGDWILSVSSALCCGSSCVLDFLTMSPGLIYCVA